MKNNYRLFCLLFLLFCFQSDTLFACKYNVRETGFIDLGTTPYYFYLYINEETSEDVISRMKQISHSMLVDCNVMAEIVNTDLQEGHSAMEFFNLWEIQSSLAAVLVSPDGQSLVVQIEKAGEPFNETLRSAIDEIKSSRKREEIIQKVIETYGVILLIEGENLQENKQLYHIASQAVKQISRAMKFMPKQIAHPPVVISLESASFEEERILLWSLGLDPDDVKSTHAAIFYGRARWIGPLMKAEEITVDNLIGILSIIGVDCECGMDISWVQGTMLPISWNQEIQTEVYHSLEFDPENPMVVMEVSRILKKGTNSYPSVPSEYQEVSRNSESYSTPYIVDEEIKPLRVLKYAFGGFVILILIAGLIIFFRAKRRVN